jgi:acetoin utilization protein AcuB
MQDTKQAPTGTWGEECSPMTVRDVMTWRVLTLRPEQSVQEAVNLFAQREFRHIPVVDGVALLGVLSDRDALRALSQQSDLATLTVASVMRREVQTVTLSTPVGEAARLLIRNRINGLAARDQFPKSQLSPAW